jgi:hypothetical protein
MYAKGGEESKQKQNKRANGKVNGKEGADLTSGGKLWEQGGWRGSRGLAWEQGVCMPFPKTQIHLTPPSHT